MREWLGRIQVWQSRLAQYVSMINFMMILFLYLIEKPFGLLWYHWVFIIGLAVVSILAIDIRIIFPESQNYIYDKNPGFVRLEKKCDLILKELGVDVSDL